MSKTIPALLLAHYAGDSTTIATLWKITRTDGQVFGFTDHDQDIIYNGVTYAAATGFDATAIETREQLNVDDLEVSGSLDSLAITEEDLVAGRWDFAEVYIYRCNWSDLTQGVEIMRRGWLGEIEVTEFGFKCEMRGLMQPLQQQLIEVSTPGCRAALGDSRCKVPLSPATWASTTAYTAVVSGDLASGDVVAPSVYNGRFFVCTTAGTSGGSEPSWNTTIGATTSDGSVVWTCIDALTQQSAVTAVTDQRIFEDSSLTQAVDWFTSGLVSWITGLNAGLSREVKSHALTGSPNGALITLTEPMPYAIQVGDTYTITAGCRKRHLLDCRDKFDNIWNYQGEPNRPTLDDVVQGPP